ncbi:hypothetical protein SNEBB_011082 [Seison nebaliae]|nr:hypothetical protein SNEBB_011082 [Seison nebaliae]
MKPPASDPTYKYNNKQKQINPPSSLDEPPSSLDNSGKSGKSGGKVKSLPSARERNGASSNSNRNIAEKEDGPISKPILISAIIGAVAFIMLLVAIILLIMFFRKRRAFRRESNVHKEVGPTGDSTTIGKNGKKSKTLGKRNKTKNGGMMKDKELSLTSEGTTDNNSLISHPKEKSVVYDKVGNGKLSNEIGMSRIKNDRLKSNILGSNRKIFLKDEDDLRANVLNNKTVSEVTDTSSLPTDPQTDQHFAEEKNTEELAKSFVNQNTSSDELLPTTTANKSRLASHSRKLKTDFSKSSRREKRRSSVRANTDSSIEYISYYVYYDSQGNRVGSNKSFKM